ncbi:MAG: hypothetical protein V8R81_00935 [Clostridia bacterium]
MRIVLDTELKKTICPKAFFENIRRLNEASALTGRKEEIDIKEYLNSIIEECRKDIINEKDVPKRTRVRKAKLGTIEITPSK